MLPFFFSRLSKVLSIFFGQDYRGLLGFIFKLEPPVKKRCDTTLFLPHLVSCANINWKLQFEKIQVSEITFLMAGMVCQLWLWIVGVVWLLYALNSWAASSHPCLALNLPLGLCLGIFWSLYGSGWSTTLDVNPKLLMGLIRPKLPMNS